MPESAKKELTTASVDLDERAAAPRSRVMLSITPIFRRDPDAPPFPPYTDEPEIVPPWMWRVGQVMALAIAVVVITLLFVSPETGLVTWWLFLLPTLPLIWVLAPGLWRNVCPMATLNQIPRTLGIGKEWRVPYRARKHAYLFQVVFYFSAISTRAPFLDHNGPALGWLMICALVAALVGGLLFTGKSGWCGTFCPLMPVQKLYGQTPQVVFKNSHCPTCVGCIENCYDFNPRVAAVADMNHEDRQWVAYRKLFGGSFPGFILAFFTIPKALVAEPVDPSFHVLQFYGLTLLYMATSLGLFFLVESLLPSVSPTVLVMSFGMLALNLHNVLRFFTTWRVHKPTWLLVVEGVIVFVITALVVRRTLRQEKLIYAEADKGTPGLPRSPTASGSRLANYEVVFDGQRSASVGEGRSLLDAARKAKAPVNSGCGSGVCGSDPVQICSGNGGLSDVTAQERLTLARLGLDRPGVRLACSARVSGPVEVNTTISKDMQVGEPAEDGNTEQVVIIGNGVAGSTVAQKLVEQDDDVSVHVLTNEPHSYYNRMAIADAIHGTRGTAGLQMGPPGWAREVGVEESLNTHVTSIDRAAQNLRLGTGDTLGYDTLVLATGSDAVRPDLPGVDLPGVFVMRTANDAVNIRAYAQRYGCERAVVLGGGLLGLEAAYGLRELGLHSSVITGGRRLLHRQLDEHGSALLSQYLQEAGIELLTEPSAQAVIGAARAEALQLSDGSQVSLDLLVLCVGARPCTELAEEAGLEVARGVVVDDKMRTSDERIYAVGDVAEHRGQVVGLWAAATEQAEVAAAQIGGDSDRRYQPNEFAAVLKDVGLDVVSIGCVDPIDGDEIIAVGSEDAPEYLRVVLRGTTVVGGIAIGRPGLSSIVSNAVRKGVELDAGAIDRIRRSPGDIVDVLPDE